MANIPLKSIKFPGLDDTYTVAVTDTTLSESGVPADAKATRDALETKADKDGYYSDLTAGTAEQLLASQSVVDKVPYLFRTSGGSADIGDREYEKIVGGTIAWNQIVPATMTSVPGITNNGDGSFTVEANIDKYPTIGTYVFVQGHIYLQNTNGGADRECYLRVDKLDGTPVSTKNTPVIWRWTDENISRNIMIRAYNPTQNYTIWPQLYDLTAMFGSTIADYLYTLETATPGAGVAWFKKLFPNEYYDYNAGELISVSGLQSHDTVGFNQWDEEITTGYFDNSGNWVNNASYLSSKNPIPVLPNTTYCCYCGSGVNVFGTFFTESVPSGASAIDKFINRSGIANSGIGTFTTPPNCYAMHFNVASTYGATYKNDICINLSWSGYRNGEYEPYDKHSYPLDSSLTLRGVPKLDAENNLYYDGDTYESDGTVTRKYGIYVFTGNETWSVGSTAGRFALTMNDIAAQSTVENSEQNIFSSKYGRFKYVNADKIAYINTLSDSRSIVINDSSFSTVAECKAAFAGSVLVYELATPTTETAEPYQSQQIVNDFGTEEYVTSSVVPVGHETKYPANLRDKLQHLPDLAENDGYYAIKQEGSQLSLELFRIPKAPTTDGNYTLKATVSGGVPTYTWESEGE